jgi:dGTPase
VIVQGDEVGEAMLSLRSFMFERVYLGPQVEPQHKEAERVVRAVFTRLADEPERLPPGEGAVDERITDYLAGMTDRFALAYAERLAAE